MLTASRENCALTSTSDWSYTHTMDQLISDEELMLSYRQGDASAFEHLYARHKGGLYRFVLRQCGDRNTCDELFQDVWMKLIQNKKQYEVKAKFTTYLYTIARNHLIGYHRKTGIHIVKEGFVDLETIEGRQQEQPENQVDLHRRTTRLLAGIEALPLLQREALLLKEEAGMKLQEIATLTGVNTETVKSRLRYAVTKL
ncbi:MAG: RNA polymerase sigma-70 factor (ECF subfamily), partial [Gammaproteobacteria bacterium]